MNDIERRDNSLPVSFDAINNTASELNGSPSFNIPVLIGRQEIIDDILSRNYPSKEAQVADLNKHIADWDDEDGISYAYISGRELPGLKVNVPATALSFAANYAPNADFRDANLDYAVFSASVIPGIKLKGASLDHAVMPVSRLSGDARGVSAVKSVLNLADISGLDIRGVDFGAAYLVGTRGLDQEKLTGLADVQEAISTLSDDRVDEELASFLGESVSRFTSDAVGVVLRRLRHPQLFSGLNSSETILRKQLRDRRQGMLLHEVMMIGSEMTKYDFEGNIWHEVIADRATAIAARFAGAILLNSSLDNADTRGVYSPGMVAIESSFRNTPLPKNSAGSVYFESDLTGADIDEVEPGGTVVIGGISPTIAPKINHIRALRLDQAPVPVVQNLKRLQGAAIKPREVRQYSSKELES